MLRHLPGAMIVKAFNTIYFKHLQHLVRPAGAVDRSYLPIAGDFAPAKAAGTPVWGTPYGPYSNETGQPAGEGPIRAALARADADRRSATERLRR